MAKSKALPYGAIESAAFGLTPDEQAKLESSLRMWREARIARANLERAEQEREAAKDEE